MPRELPEDAETAEKTASHGETEQRRQHGGDACDQRPAKPTAIDQHELRANTNSVHERVCARARFVLIAARAAGGSHAMPSAPFRLCVFVSPCETVFSAVSAPSDNSRTRFTCRT